MAVISRTVLREQVKDVLLQRIASGELEPGERLVETRIAQELGTSQAPVREALRDLELLRLVESEPFRGSRVRVFGEEEMIEVYPVRAVARGARGAARDRQPRRRRVGARGRVRGDEGRGASGTTRRRSSSTTSPSTG